MEDQGASEDHHVRLSRAARIALCAALVFAAVLLVVAPRTARTSAWADEAASRTVRVAFPQQENMTWTDENGSRSGYVYEYLERIAQYTGWRYEFVPVEATGADAYRASTALLETGDVDLVCGVMLNERNAERFLLSSNGYIRMSSLLQTLDDDPGSFRIQDMGTLRVAALDAPELVADAERYCAVLGVELELVPCDDVDERLEALRAGRADVALSSSVADRTGLETVAELSSHLLHFACSRGESQLMCELDDAMTSIANTEATLESDLTLKYFGEAASETTLTAEERAFVASVGAIRVGVLRDDPPYQYEQDGVVQGVAVSFLRQISEGTGLTFEFVGVETEDELDRMLAEGSVDMVASVDCNYEAANDRGLRLTQPYASASYVLVANDNVQEGEISGKRLAVLASSRYRGPYVGEVAAFEGRRACLQAVVDGEADYTYVDEYVMQFFLDGPEYRGLRIAPQMHEARKVGFGVAGDADPLLLKVMDKGLGSLGEMERQAAINGSVLVDDEYSWVDYARANPVQTVAVVVSIVLVVVALVLIILYQQARAKAKTALDLKKRLRLYSLSDDYFYEFDLQRNSILVSVPSRDGVSLSDPVSMTLDASNFAVDDASRERFLELMHANERTVEEVQLPDADGILHWLRITVEPVREGSSRAAYSVGAIEVIDDERREKDRLVAKAEHDGLTRVLNAATMRSRVGEWMAALGEDETAGLLIVDVDDFKGVNDLHGHPAGDRVLAGVAMLLRERVRVGDVVGRIGGDEFMVYLHRIQNEDELSSLCETLCREAARREFCDVGFGVTVSIGGVAVHGPCSYEDMYEKADEALYEAKRQGRNRSHVVEG